MQAKDNGRLRAPQTEVIHPPAGDRFDRFDDVHRAGVERDRRPHLFREVESAVQAYSAKVLLNPTPVTLSPGLKLFTALPTSSTIPAGSWPNLSG